ncbi:ATP-binding cassette domain-containing protein [Methanospirillum stamsii]|uniref:ABC transporter ATP-binding protein n=1 Tax=Methanospirillum stamsii TaxID=1277351 RepID=A0A2V2N6K8_9EURY|nr:ATP-binding cassette domain-containing protein [Methanospirillum stamsii]PWR75712.1 ABC transporter ATP-binding protein [Methanospirillum stamsii]
MTAIQTEDLTKFFGDFCAVNGLNIEADKEIFGLLGPNGSGKTTTVLMLTTLLTQDRGTASICGYDTRKDPDKVRSSISYVPQDMAIDTNLTGRENMLFFAKLYGVSNPRDRVDELLEVMELSSRADDLAKTYSGGMRRRLELAEALVHEPEVIFLDEPTLGLDVAARKKIWEHIHALNRKGMTIFVTTHYMDEADRYCDRVGIINHGMIAVLGKPAELKSHLMKDVISVIVNGEYVPVDLEGVLFVGQSGDELSFTAENGREALPTLADALSRAGNSIRAMSLREPTLDDVFLQSVGKQEESTGFEEWKYRLMLRRR